MTLAISHSDTLDPSKQRSRKEKMLDFIGGIDTSRFNFDTVEDQINDAESYSQQVAGYQAPTSETVTGKPEDAGKQDMTAQQSQEAYRDYLTTLHEDYMGIAKPKRDVDRERQLRRAGKVQGYTNAASTLSQVFGAFGGADVPKIQYKNEPAQELLKLQDAFADDERRAQMTALNAAIQGLAQKKSQDFSKAQQDDQQEFSGEQSQKQREYYQGENDKNRTHQEDLTKLRTDENVRQLKETQQYVPGSDRGLIGKKNKVTGEFFPYAGQGGGSGGSGSGRGKDKEEEYYFEVYDKGSNKPVTQIKTRDQAINLVSDIITENKNNPEFQEDIERIIGGNAYGLNPLSEVSDQGIKLIIDRYWRKNTPYVDESVNPQYQQGQRVSDYRLTDFNEQDRVNLNEFISNNIDASASDVYNFIKKYDPAIPDDIARDITKREFEKVQGDPRRNQQWNDPQHIEKVNTRTVDTYIQNPQNIDQLRDVAQRAKKYYPDSPADQRNAVRTYLKSIGMSEEQINMTLKK